MAKVKLNPIIEQLRGQVGDLVFKRYAGQVVVGRKPDQSSVEPSAAQLEHQERFRQAVLYGQVVMADPQKKAAYQDAAKALGKPIFSLMVADFFNAPVVDELDLSNYSGSVGDQIIIRAHDDFEVTSVQVSITNAFNGQAIESGPAVETPLKSGRWVYTATTALAQGADVRVTAAVSDRPGGTSQATAEKSF